MKKLCLFFCIILQIISTYTYTYADETDIEYTAAQMSNFSENLSINTSDLSEYLSRVFKFQPELEFYYQGYSAEGYGNHYNVTLKYENTEIPINEIHIAKNEDELKDAIIRAMLYCDEKLHLVSNKEVDFEAIVGQVVDNNKIVSMGYSGSNYVTFRSQLTNNICYDIKFNYSIDSDTLLEYKKITEERAFSIASDILAKSMPDYVKEKVIHDYIAHNTDYSDENGEISYMPYDALVNGQGVCSAYASSAKILMDMVGIENIYITGTATSDDKPENHGWNIVKIGGNYYHLDVTWDDPVSTWGFDNVNYKYFNVTDREIGKDHVWEKSKYPACNNTEFSYDNIEDISDEDAYTDYYNFSDFKSVFDEYKPLNSDYIEPISEYITESQRERSTSEHTTDRRRNSDINSMPFGTIITISIFSLVALIVFAVFNKLNE